MIFRALGKRKPKQDERFSPTAKLVTGPGHPFYAKLKEVLAEAGFDAFAEKLCSFQRCGLGRRLSHPLGNT